MNNLFRRPISMFAIAGAALILGLASLGFALHAASVRTPATTSCPGTGIVKCIVPAPHEHVAAFIAQPLTWIGFVLLVVAIISAIVGAARRSPPAA